MSPGRKHHLCVSCARDRAARPWSGDPGLHTPWKCSYSAGAGPGPGVSLRLLPEGPKGSLLIEPCPTASFRGYKLTYTKNPSSPSSLKIFPMELSTPL